MVRKFIKKIKLRWDLKSNWTNVQSNAVRELVKMEGEKAAFTLLSAMRNEKCRAVVNEIESALMKIGRPVIDDLISILQNPDSSYRDRIYSVDILGVLRDSRAVAPITDFIKDKDWILRARVVNALSLMADPAAFEALVEALTDEKPDIRREAIRGLANINILKAQKYFVNLLENDKDHWVRRDAVQTLGKVANAQAEDAILHALKHDLNEFVRTEAVHCLGKIGEERFLPFLLQALQDEKSEVRAGAAWVLSNYSQNPRIVTPLINTLRDSEGNVCDHAVVALGMTGDREAVDPLLELLDRNNDYRPTACYSIPNNTVLALGKIGDVRALPKILHEMFGYDSCHVHKADHDKLVEAFRLLVTKSNIQENILNLIIEASDRNKHTVSKAIEGLRAINNPIANNILYLVSKRKDISITVNIACAIFETRTYDLNEQREAALEELNLRGVLSYDPTIYSKQVL